MAGFKQTLAALVTMLAASGAQANPGAVIQKLKIANKPGAAEQEYACTDDHVWCVSHPRAAQGEDPGAASILHLEHGDLRWLGSIALRGPVNSTDIDAAGADYAPWTSIIRLTPQGEGEIALIGIMQTQNALYSGGGAVVTRLLTYEVRPERPGEFPLRFDAPWSSDIDIRACFGEKDVKARGGACSDHYILRASLEPLGESKLIYKTRATTYPGVVKRSEDSNAASPLKKGDLRTVTNAQCSVTRTLTRDAATGVFAWDSPLPACSDFLEP
jgi:hypothetical protein